jgi:hypothetical protein
MFNSPKGGNMSQYFIPLLDEQRETVNTEIAAGHLDRKPQTLRTWACKENGPILPIRIHGRLAWRVADLRALIAGEE